MLRPDFSVGSTISETVPQVCPSQKGSRPEPPLEDPGVGLTDGLRMALTGTGAFLIGWSLGGSFSRVAVAAVVALLVSVLVVTRYLGRCLPRGNGTRWVGPKELAVLQAFDDLDDGMVLLDEQGVVLYANRAAERLLGRPRAELAGKPGRLLLPEAAGDSSVARTLLTLQRQPKGRRNLLEFPAPVGPWKRWYVQLNHLHRTEHACSVVVLRDVTWQLYVDMALRRLLELESSPDVFQFLRAAVEELGQLFEADAAFLAPIGRAPSVGLKPLMWHKGAFLEDVPEGLSAAVPSVPVTEGGLCFISHGARLAHPEDRFIAHYEAEGYAAIPIEISPGSVVAVLGVLSQCRWQEDPARLALLSVFGLWIGARLRQQYAIFELERARHHAEEAARAKSIFLANMSHEIRTPLTAIVGHSQLLQSGDLTEEESREAIQQILRSSLHLLTLVNDVLDVCKVESGKVTSSPRACDIRQLLEDAIGSVVVTAQSKGLKVSWHLAQSVPERVVVDGLKLKQIVLNLLNNAVRFTHAGRIELVGALVQQDGSPWLRIHVADTGIGIPPEALQRIFEPFEQVDHRLTREYGGTGLGLYLCKKLAHILGGHILVDSTPEQGSCFVVEVPVSTDAGTEFCPDSSSSQRRLSEWAQNNQQLLSGVRVLVGEDVLANRILIQRLLEKSGAHVKAVANGRDVVKTALEAQEKGHPYHVILLDMQMPVVDGYTAAGELRDRGYQRPIVALTAHALTGDRDECLVAGCDDYLAKPVDRSTLVERVRFWADRAAELAPQP
jgi:PAS domain S-box-containing protein